MIWFMKNQVSKTLHSFKKYWSEFAKVSGKAKEVEQENFIRLCEWLEGERDSFSVIELHKKVKDLVKSNEFY